MVSLTEPSISVTTIHRVLYLNPHTLSQTVRRYEYHHQSIVFNNDDRCLLALYNLARYLLAWIQHSLAWDGDWRTQDQESGRLPPGPVD